jgi:hypothetical protein
MSRISSAKIENKNRTIDERFFVFHRCFLSLLARSSSPFENFRRLPLATAYFQLPLNESAPRKAQAVPAFGASLH